jgi:quercetin dioxygenase-like cupin family protein
MALKMPAEEYRITNRPFKSGGEDRVQVEIDGGMTDTGLVFHARAAKTNNLVGLTEINWSPNDASDIHRHDLEDEAFFVIEGSLTVHTPNGDFSAGEGQVVWGPRGVFHGYSIGPEGARILLVQTPGTRLAEYFEATALGDVKDLETNKEARDAYYRWARENYSLHFLDRDVHPPGQSETLRGGNGLKVEPSAIDGFAEPLAYPLRNREFVSSGKDSFELGGRRFTLHLAGDTTGGAVGIAEIEWSPNGVTPFLTHQLENQAYYVVDGEFEVILADGEDLVAGPSELIWLPRGVKHAIRCGPEGARVVLCYFPGSRIDQMFRQVAQLGDFSSDPERFKTFLAWAADTYSVEMDLDLAPPPKA